MKPKQRMALRIVSTVGLFMAAVIGLAYLVSSLQDDAYVESSLTVLHTGRGTIKSDGREVFYFTTEEHGPTQKIVIQEETYFRLQPGKRYKFRVFRDKRTGEPIGAIDLR